MEKSLAFMRNRQLAVLLVLGTAADRGRRAAHRPQDGGGASKQGRRAQDGGGGQGQGLAHVQLFHEIDLDVSTSTGTDRPAAQWGIPLEPDELAQLSKKLGRLYSPC